MHFGSEHGKLSQSPCTLTQQRSTISEYNLVYSCRFITFSSSCPSVPPALPVLPLFGPRSQSSQRSIGFIRSYATNVIQPGRLAWPGGGGRILLEGGFGLLSSSSSPSLDVLFFPNEWTKNNFPFRSGVSDMNSRCVQY